jgi:twitching motility two-component system response regulator PilH
MSRVLLVDDSHTVLNFLQAVFESEEFEVMTASDATAGLARTHQSPPDLIVTDSIMPGLDGFEFLRTLREDPATEAIPVIMLTSSDPDDPEYADRRPRPDAFVKKSSDVGPLLIEVRLALKKRP